MATKKPAQVKNLRNLAKEWRQQVLSYKRIGRTPADRLKWVLQFADTNLDLLHEEEKVALGYDLKALFLSRTPEGDTLMERIERLVEVIERPKVLANEKQLLAQFKKLWPDSEFGTTIQPIPQQLIREVQAELKSGLRQLFSDHGIWQLPVPSSMNLERTTPLDAKRSRFALQAGMYSADDQKRPLIYALSETLIQAPDLLRQCAECGKPFIPVRRQEYCSASCSQKARDRRRKRKPK